VVFAGNEEGCDLLLGAPPRPPIATTGAFDMPPFQRSYFGSA